MSYHHSTALKQAAPMHIVFGIFPKSSRCLVISIPHCLPVLATTAWKNRKKQLKSGEQCPMCPGSTRSALKHGGIDYVTWMPSRSFARRSVGGSVGCRWWWHPFLRHGMATTLAKPGYRLHHRVHAHSIRKGNAAKLVFFPRIEFLTRIENQLWWSRVFPSYHQPVPCLPQVQ